MKQPRRAEGLQFKNAQDKPYLNMGEKPDADLVPMQLKDFTPQEQFKLSVTYPKMKIPQTIAQKTHCCPGCESIFAELCVKRIRSQ